MRGGSLVTIARDARLDIAVENKNNKITQTRVVLSVTFVAANTSITVY